jgi:hypothetical protein
MEFAGGTGPTAMERIVMPNRDMKGTAEQEGGMSRRLLLRGAATAGAAGLAVAAIGVGASPALAATERPAAPQGNSQAHPQEPIMVHVRDAATGDIEVFSGTSSTRVRDKDLAARITRALG